MQRTYAQRRRKPGDNLLVGGAARTYVACNGRSEEHTSELQSHSDLVCRLLLEKKNKTHQHRVQDDGQRFALPIQRAIAARIRQTDYRRPRSPGRCWASDAVVELSHYPQQDTET